MENAYQVIQVHLQLQIVIRVLLPHTAGIRIPKNAVHVNKVILKLIIQIIKLIQIT